MLRVAGRLAQSLAVTVKRTFLGAHALPEEYKDRGDEYIELVCNEMLPKVAEQGIADAVDVFCENIGFTLNQTKQVFAAAKRYGLPIKVHAEQLSNLGATELAASCQALSGTGFGSRFLTKLATLASQFIFRKTYFGNVALYGYLNAKEQMSLGRHYHQ